MTCVYGLHNMRKGENSAPYCLGQCESEEICCIVCVNLDSDTIVQSIGPLHDPVYSLIVFLSAQCR